MDESIRYPDREPGVFVLWEAGRECQDRILADLASRFHINRVTEIHWDPEMVWANYQRFYADAHIRGSAHARIKGSGPFLAISLVVDSPVYERRLTRNRGWRQVVSQMFDAKTCYREWTSGWGVHSTENLAESLRDAYMLFGSEALAWEDGTPQEWSGAIDVLRQDPTGAHGWQSFDELLRALNRGVEYVLLRYGQDGDSLDGLTHGDSFEILTSDYYSAHSILHCGRRIPSPLKQGGEIETRVAGKPVKLNLRFPGDGLFDKAWAASLFETRVLDEAGYYRPREDEQYWLMAHHVVATRAPIDSGRMAELSSHAAEGHLASADLPVDDHDLRVELTNQLRQRGIWDGKNQSPLGAAFGIVASGLSQRYQILAARFRTQYFAARDSLLAHLPILTYIKQSIKTLASGN